MKMDWTLIGTILLTVIVGSFIARFVERAIGFDIPGLG